jgi:purine-binding chemotaxis protein CheW
MPPEGDAQAEALGAHRIRHILDARTAALARRGAAAARRAPDGLVLACAVGGETYGLALDAVAEVVSARPVVMVPGAVPPVLGAIGLAGRIWTVLDLRAALGLAAPAGQEIGAGHLLRLRHAQRRLVLRVDRALCVTPIFAAPGGEPAAELAKRGVTGYAVAPPATVAAQETLLGLLDLDALLTPVLMSSSAVGA